MEAVISASLPWFVYACDTLNTTSIATAENLGGAWSLSSFSLSDTMFTLLVECFIAPLMYILTFVYDIFLKYISPNYYKYLATHVDDMLLRPERIVMVVGILSDVFTRTIIVQYKYHKNITHNQIYHIASMRIFVLILSLLIRSDDYTYQTDSLFASSCVFVKYYGLLIMEKDAAAEPPTHSEVVKFDMKMWFAFIIFNTVYFSIQKFASDMNSYNEYMLWFALLVAVQHYWTTMVLIFAYVRKRNNELLPKQKLLVSLTLCHLLCWSPLILFKLGSYLHYMTPTIFLYQIMLCWAGATSIVSFLWLLWSDQHFRRCTSHYIKRKTLTSRDLYYLDMVLDHEAPTYETADERQLRYLQNYDRIHMNGFVHVF